MQRRHRVDLLFVILCCNKVAQLHCCSENVLVMDIKYKMPRYFPRNHRILEVIRLKKISKMIKSNC